MRALLLAAGLGTRLRPITDTVPKCMVEINGRPLLDYWIELLSNGGITEILINLHYLPEKVKAYAATCNYPVKITMVMEEQLLLTAGTVLKNRAYFKNSPFLLIHADNLSRFDLRSFMDRYHARASNIDITMMTFRADVPNACGIVELDETGTVIRFHEKVKSPPSNLANGAVYILSPVVLDFIANLGREIIDFSTEVLPHFMGRINTFHNNVYHRDIGNLESLRVAQSEYL